MIRSLESAVSGLRNHQIRMDVIGNNIANVNTSGFKSSRANFQDILSQTIRIASGPITGGSINPAQVGLGMTIAGVSLNASQGNLEGTGRTLDVAIQGNGFFVIKKEDGGNSFYSREGAFALDSEGYLVNYNGYYVCDDGGERIQLSSSPETIGTITITDTGSITVDGVTVALLGLAFMPNPEGMLKEGQNLYRTTNASGEATISVAGTTDSALENTRLSSGYLEMSNVDLTNEMTNMIITQRGYQANARVITVSDSLLQELVDLKR